MKRIAPGFINVHNPRPRMKALPEDRVRPANLDGHDVFEIATPEVPYRIRALRFGSEVAILVTPGSCPRLVAVDQCSDGVLQTELKTVGTAPCLGPISVPREVKIAFQGRSLKETLTLGTPFSFSTPSNQIQFAIYLPGEDDPAANVSRTVNNVDEPLPEEVLGYLRAGYDSDLKYLYRGLEEEARTPEFVAEVVQARVENLRKIAAKRSTPQGIYELIQANPKDHLPGDVEIADVLLTRISELSKETAEGEPTPQKLFDLGLFSDLYLTIDGARPDFLKYADKFSTLLHQGLPDEPAIQGRFLRIFAGSKYAAEIEAEARRDAEQEAAEAQKAEAERAKERAWEEVRARGDELAALAYRIRFGRQNFVQSRHNRRGLESMALHHQGLVRDAFCPAKREALKLLGSSGYAKKAMDHCREDAPIETGVGGVPVPITKECQVAFSTGC